MEFHFIMNIISKQIPKFVIIIFITILVSNVKGQGMLISFEKAINTESFLDSTASFTESEFINTSPYCFISIKYIENSIYVTYSNSQVEYDSTGFRVKSISGIADIYQASSKLSLEEIKNNFIKGYLGNIFYPITNIDSKQEAYIGFLWKINGLNDYCYPYLVWLYYSKNRAIAKIFKIESIKSTKD